MRDVVDVIIVDIIILSDLIFAGPKFAEYPESQILEFLAELKFHKDMDQFVFCLFRFCEI